MQKIVVRPVVHGVLAVVCVPERVVKELRARTDILYLKGYMQVIVNPVLAKKVLREHIVLVDGAPSEKLPMVNKILRVNLVPQKVGQGHQASTILEEILIFIYQAPYQHQRHIILVLGAEKDGDVTAKEVGALSRHGLPHHLPVHIRLLWDT